MFGLFLLSEESYSTIRARIHIDLHMLLRAGCCGRKRQNGSRHVLTLDTPKNPVGSWNHGLVRCLSW